MKAIGLHYGRWLIRCMPQRIAGGWCAVVEVWQSGRDPHRNLKEIRETVPFTTLFDNTADACVAGLEAGKRWIDARSER